MNVSVFLQAFLLIDVFFVGVLVTVAITHAVAHRRAKQQPSTQPTPPIQPLREALPPMTRERLVKESESKFQDALNQSANDLQASLGSTASQLDQLLRHLGAEIVGNELERYRAELTQLRKQAQVDMGAIKVDVDKHRAELEAQLEQELTAEKEQIIERINTRLADAVASFLVETLQHNIDLGAQEAYLRSMLDEHKADFVKEVANEPDTAK